MGFIDFPRWPVSICKIQPLLQPQEDFVNRRQYLFLLFIENLVICWLFGHFSVIIIKTFESIRPSPLPPFVWLFSCLSTCVPLSPINKWIKWPRFTSWFRKYHWMRPPLSFFIFFHHTNGVLLWRFFRNIYFSRGISLYRADLLLIRCALWKGTMSRHGESYLRKIRLSE